MMQNTQEGVILLQAKSHGSIADDTPIVYFDGSCPLCTAEINHYASKIGAGKLHLVDVSAQGVDLRSDLTVEDAMSRFHVRRANGELLSGAIAFAEIWRIAPGWTWAFRLASIPGVLPIIELSYRGFLVVRPTISRLAARLGVKAANPQIKRH